MSAGHRIFVVGASRGIGAHCVEQALASGWTVHALARGPLTRVGSHPRLMPIAGDCRNPTLLAEGVMGCDAVVSAVGIGPTWSPVSLFSEHMRALIAAMSAGGPRRLIAVTGLGAGDSRGHGGLLYDRVFFPLFLARMYADKDRQEALIRDSGLDWTILRPAVLTDGPADGPVQALTRVEQYHGGRIARAAVARYILACIAEGLHLRETPVLVA